MLIADSGATKTEWRYCEDGKVVADIRTQGFNPSTHPLDQLTLELSLVAQEQGWKNVQNVYFYSTGTGTPRKRNDLFQALSIAFPQAEIQVADDLLGAARATQRVEGMVAIMGTGSNSAWHKNGKLLERRGGLGYLFGDEGAGADLGKFLLKGILEDRFPPEVAAFLAKKEKQSAQTLMRTVYQHPKPQVRLAALTHYLPELWHYPAVRKMILNRFDVFLERVIEPYAEAHTLPLDIIGSIGYYFRALLQTACEARNIQLGDAILHPIEALTQYHLQ